MEQTRKPFKSIAFICAASDFAKITDVSSALQSTLFVALNAKLAESVQKAGYECKILFDYLPADKDQELRKKVILWIDHWADGSDGFKKTIFYRGLSLWWFALPVIFPDTLRCIRYIEAVKNILNESNIEEAIIIAAEKNSFPLRLNRDIELSSKVIEETCRAEGLQIRKVRAGFLPRLKAKYYFSKIQLAYRCYYPFGARIFGFIRRKLLGLSNRKRKLPKSKNILVCSSPVYWRTGFDGLGNFGPNDVIVDSTVKVLKQRGYELFGIDVELNTPSFQRLEVLGQKRKCKDVYWTAIESLLCNASPKKKLEREKFTRKINRSWLTEKKKNFKMLYADVDIAPFMYGRFDFLFAYYFDQALSYWEAINEAVDLWRPLLMVLVYEEGAHGRAAVQVGHIENIPTVALQHGMLAGPFHPAYYFKNVNYEGKGNSTDCPIPTKTAVFGQQTKEILTKSSSYPEESVEVVGNPSYDGLLSKNHDKLLLAACDLLQIDSNKQVILVNSQPFFNPEEKEYFITCVLDTAEKVPEVQWVIKLHPTELGKDWEQAIKFRGNRVNLMIAVGNLQAWLVVCKVLVAWYSTTMIEAAIMRKNVIALRIPGCINADEYIKDRIAIGADNQESLAELLWEFKNNGWKKNLNSSSISLNKYVLQTNRPAAEGIVDLIETLVKN